METTSSGLPAKDVEVVSGWEAAYNGSFSAGGSGGDRPLVVSYASSPAAARASWASTTRTSRTTRSS